MVRPTCVLLAAFLSTAAPVCGQEQVGVPNPRWGAFFSGKDQRVPMEPAVWPWHAIGRVNIADSVTRRHCTGTLVGTRLVLTAGHCLFDHRLGRWAKPEHVHFVAGQARDTSSGHSRAEELIIPPELDMAGGSDPARRTMRADLIAHDWALIRLQTALGLKPVPVKPISDGALAQEISTGEIARAGYSADRSYLLSVHRGCSAAVSDHMPGAMLNRRRRIHLHLVSEAARITPAPAADTWTPTEAQLKEHEGNYPLWSAYALRVFSTDAKLLVPTKSPSSSRPSKGTSSLPNPSVSRSASSATPAAK